MPFSDPIVGGSGMLLRSAIRSPNYVPGSAGWTVNQDGTAEFTGVTINGGTVVVTNAAGAVFVYSAAPALGNLVASIAAAAGTDAFGNAYPAGISALGSSGATAQLVSTGTSGELSLTPTPLPPRVLLPGYVVGNNTGGGSPRPAIQMVSPVESGHRTGSIVLAGETATNLDVSLQVFTDELLATVIVDQALPAIVENAVNNTIAITSVNVFAALPAPGPLTATVVNPSANHNLVVRVEYQAWMQANGAATRAGVAGTGSNVFSPLPGTGGSVAFGQTLYLPNVGNTNTFKETGSITVTIPSGGTTTFELQAFKETGGTTNAVNYPVLTATPLYFK